MLSAKKTEQQQEQEEEEEEEEEEEKGCFSPEMMFMFSLFCFPPVQYANLDPSQRPERHTHRELDYLLEQREAKRIAKEVEMRCAKPSRPL